jgi:hypothetical protein
MAIGATLPNRKASLRKTSNSVEIAGFFIRRLFFQGRIKGIDEGGKYLQQIIDLFL